MRFLLWGFVGAILGCLLAWFALLWVAPSTNVDTATGLVLFGALIGAGLAIVIKRARREIAPIKR